MTTKTTSVSFGRARLPNALAAQLTTLPPGLRGRTVALIVLAHTTGLDLQKLVASANRNGGGDNITCVLIHAG